MKWSERVRGGFWRIGLVGLCASATGAFFAVALAIYSAVAIDTVTVWNGTRTLQVPAYPTREDIAEAYLKRDAVEWLRSSDLPLTDERITLLISQAADKRREAWQSPLYWALGLSIAGAFWLGMWWLMGWIVRGFLE